MKLSDIRQGERAVIVKVAGHGGFRRRIVEMGFIKGKVVEMSHAAPLGDPIEYVVMNSHVSLRKTEASKIEVISIAEAEGIAMRDKKSQNSFATITEDEIRQVALDRRREITVALIGNPNAGKTSLFNALTGQHQKVGNYAGVTVDAKEGSLNFQGYNIHLVDLPGTYSISAYSPEERYVRQQIVEGRPDVIINVVDASNLERNLFLTTQLIDMNLRMVVALNMFDELEKRGDRFDHEQLSAMIGVPMIPTVTPRMSGINELFEAVIKVYEGGDYIDAYGNIIDSAAEDPLLDRHYHQIGIAHHHTSKELSRRSNLDLSNVHQRVRHIHINYGPIVEQCITRLKNSFSNVDGGISDDYTPRYIAIKLLENDPDIDDYINGFSCTEDVFAIRKKCCEEIRSEMKDSPENIIQDAKYGFIAGALKETYVHSQRTKSKTKTETIDNIVTSKFFGYPIFLLAVFLMFQATFILGQYPMDWIESGVNLLATWLGGVLPSGMLSDLLIDGVIQGMGGVLVFLPNILILYFFITMLEVSGYMARAAFIMDKIMHVIGLHGRSFIPLIMGFGCNVPAIMATRTIENRNARMITILITPLMSCSARLPLYLLFAGAFFPQHAGIVVFCLYIAGVVLAAIMAIVFRKIFFSKEEIPFVMELPPYRLPSLKMIARDTWEKCVQYLKKIGTTILFGSILIWALSYFPTDPNTPTHQMTKEQRVMQQENSYLGQIGHAIEPIMRPLGFDWRVSVSLITGVAAKEIVVSTMGILYNTNSDDFNTMSDDIISGTDDSGEPIFTMAAALSLMLFVLIYMPCVATIATIASETHSWLWAVFAAVYTIALAWIISFAAYQSIILNIWQETIVGLIVTISVIIIARRLIHNLRHRHDSNPNKQCSGTCMSSSCGGCSFKQ